MKTVLFFATGLFFTFNAIAGNNNSVNYVITSNDSIACKNVVLESDYVRVDMPDYTFAEIKHADVKAFCLNGKRFENLPVYRNNRSTGKYAFMELVNENNGFKLYQYTENGNVKQCVFQNNKYYVGVTAENKSTLLGFFNENITAAN